MFERIAEQKIREAMREGKFAGVARPGTPIDLDEYFKVPAELRIAYSLLKSAGHVPQEVELLNELAALEQEQRAAVDDESRRKRAASMADVRLKLELAIEGTRRRSI